MLLYYRLAKTFKVLPHELLTLPPWAIGFDIAVLEAGVRAESDHADGAMPVYVVGGA
jgi:hypothetical protein